MYTMYIPTIYLFSLGSKPVGVHWVAINFSCLILFTVMLFVPQHQPSLRIRAWDRHRNYFLFLWQGSEICMKQKSSSKFRHWSGFELRIWQSNGCKSYHYTTAHPIIQQAKH